MPTTENFLQDPLDKRVVSIQNRLKKGISIPLGPEETKDFQSFQLGTFSLSSHQFERAFEGIEAEDIKEDEYDFGLSSEMKPTDSLGFDSVKWIDSFEGFVREVDEETFTAELHSFKHDSAQISVELIKSDVDESDKPLIQVGAPFYLYVGYTFNSGMKCRSSAIYFKRTAPISELDIQKVEREATEFLKSISVE